MELIFPINLVGHDEWMDSGYAINLAQGDVITRDGEVLGTWRVVDYDPEAGYGHEDGRYEFVENGQDEALFSESFAVIDSRVMRGYSLKLLTLAIRKWHEGGSH